MTQRTSSCHPKNALMEEGGRAAPHSTFLLYFEVMIAYSFHWIHSPKFDISSTPHPPNPSPSHSMFNPSCIMFSFRSKTVDLSITHRRTMLDVNIWINDPTAGVELLTNTWQGRGLWRHAQLVTVPNKTCFNPRWMNNGDDQLFNHAKNVILPMINNAD